MSRVGKKIIAIPNGVEVTLKDQDIRVKGAKGTLSHTLHPMVQIQQQEQTLALTVRDEEVKDQRALWGLERALVANMVAGVTEGFSKQLEINGIGFKAAMKGKDLELNVGFSHPVSYKAPEGIQLAVEKNIITVSGADKQLVGQTAAEIRGIKKPEPYKGKGIKYIDEVIRRKQGKVVKAA